MNDRALRKHLLELLKGGSAHITFDEAVADLHARLRGAKPKRQPHTAWRLLEHMRIAQSDILRFCRDPDHDSPDWPDEYWPATDAPPTPKSWNNAVRAFRRDLRAMQKLISDPKNDLLAPIPHGTGQTLAREAMLLADHNAYHIGQLVLLRRLLGAWDE